MREAFFVYTDDKKQSYTDYYDLISLSGIPLLHINKINQSKNIYISDIYSLDFFPNISNPFYDLVLWFLERPSSYLGISNLIEKLKKDILEKGLKQIWVSDICIYQLLKNELPCVFVPIGSHWDLVKKDNSIKQYDCAHMSYIEKGSRREILYSIGCDFAPPNPYFFGDILGWGDYRNNILQKTKFILNIHQDSNLFFEPLRFAVAAAHGIPLITENCYDCYPYQDLVLEAPLSEFKYLVEKTIKEDYNSFKELGEKTHNYICGQFSFDNNVKKALLGV